AFNCSPSASCIASCPREVACTYLFVTALFTSYSSVIALEQHISSKALFKISAEGLTFKMAKNKKFLFNLANKPAIGILLKTMNGSNLIFRLFFCLLISLTSLSGVYAQGQGFDLSGSIITKLVKNQV